MFKDEQEYLLITSGNDYRLNFRQLWSSKYNQFSNRNNLTIAKIDMTLHWQSHKQTRKTNNRYRSKINWKKSDCATAITDLKETKKKKKKDATLWRVYSKISFILFHLRHRMACPKVWQWRKQIKSSDKFDGNKIFQRRLYFSLLF